MVSFIIPLFMGFYKKMQKRTRYKSLTGSQEVVGSSPIFSTNKTATFKAAVFCFLIVYGFCTVTEFNPEYKFCFRWN